MKQTAEKIEYMFVLPRMWGGGAERVVSVLASALADGGHPTAVMLFEDAEVEYAVSARVVLHRLSDEGTQTTGRRAKLRFLRKWVKAHRPTFVLPFLGNVLDYSYLATRFTSSKCIATIRNNPARNVRSKKERVTRDILFRLADGVFAQTEEQLAYFPKSVQKKGFVLENPVNPRFIESTCEYRAEVRHIAAVGRLVKQKNYPLLLEAFAQLHATRADITLHIFGEGPERENILAAVSSLGLDEHVLLHGSVEDVAGALATADIYVMSSDFEGFPNALAEAMAMGLPSISTDCPTGPADLMRGGTRGVLVPVGDVSALVGAMTALVEDYETRKQYGENARQYIADHLSVEAITERFREEMMRFGT